jgi:predicted nucleic acid-binding protein
MADGISNLFWDSCVFTAFLREERAAYDIDSIEQYLTEARDGRHRIYTSSLVFAEVLPSLIIKPELGSFADFVDDFRGAIVVVDASAELMQLAGLLRDLPYKKAPSPGRRLATPDAIMLASAVHLKQAFGVNVDHFHTYDDGKRRGPDGKSVPLLSYHDWCEGFTPDQMRVARPVIDLDRRCPIHPHPRLPLHAQKTDL